MLDAMPKPQAKGSTPHGGSKGGGVQPPEALTPSTKGAKCEGEYGNEVPNIFVWYNILYLYGL